MYPFVTLFYAIVFFFFFAYLAFSFLYDCWRLPRYSNSTRTHHIRNRNRNRPAMVFFFPHNPSQTGLDPAIVISLPVFTFSSSDAAHRELIDCAVCLSEFEEGDSGRVLPGCKHAFHVECIDMWFHSHSTCPLCRSLVEPLEEQAAVIAIPPEPGSATEPGFGSSAMMPLEEAPRSRALSFTRMLSGDRRSAPSQSEPSSSCGRGSDDRI